MNEPLLNGDEIVCTRDLRHGPHADNAKFCCVCGRPMVMFVDAMSDLNNLRFALENFRLECDDTGDGWVRVQKQTADKMLEALEAAA